MNTHTDKELAQMAADLSDPALNDVLDQALAMDAPKDLAERVAAESWAQLHAPVHARWRLVGRRVMTAAAAAALAAGVVWLMQPQPAEDVVAQGSVEVPVPQVETVADVSADLDDLRMVVTDMQLALLEESPVTYDADVASQLALLNELSEMQAELAWLEY